MTVATIAHPVSDNLKARVDNFYVSVDDSEVMEFSGAGVRPNPGNTAVLELDGRSPKPPPEKHMVTEAAIRGFYHHYRDVMGY